MKSFDACWLPGALFMILLASANGQSILHSGEAVFVITVRGTSGIPFRGSYLVTTAAGESTTQQITGFGPADFKLIGAEIYVSLQKQFEGGDFEVEIFKNGASLKKQRTTAPYGVITLASRMLPIGAPKQTEIRVDGSVKFASLTLTSETGDTEQQLVEIPFSRTFFPREGWIVGLVAQKTPVTRPNPLYVDRRLEVLDNGRDGSLHVEIRVSGRVLAEAATSESLGVVTAITRIP
jgi:hypothetical protein